MNLSCEFVQPRLWTSALVVTSALVLVETSALVQTSALVSATQALVETSALVHIDCSGIPTRPPRAAGRRSASDSSGSLFGGSL